MNQKISQAAGLALLLLIAAGCTDVPLSFSKVITDERIVGYWKESDDSGFQIRKNSDGSATVIHYEFNKETKTFEQDGDPEALYFTTITDQSETFQFLSMEISGEDSKVYGTSRFYFSAAGDLVTQDINSDFLKKMKPNNGSEVIVFGSPEQYQEFVTKHLRNPELFAESNTVHKVPRLTGN